MYQLIDTWERFCLISLTDKNDLNLLEEMALLLSKCFVINIS